MRKTNWDDDESDDGDADDDDLPDGVYYDDELPTVPCPRCRAEIAEGVEYCPRCETWLTREEGDATTRGKFWLVMMALALIAALFWLVSRC